MRRLAKMVKRSKGKSGSSTNGVTTTMPKLSSTSTSEFDNVDHGRLRRVRKNGQTPQNWKQAYETIVRMRSPGGVASGAAVDDMGCERQARAEDSPKVQRFQTLIALMLSSQTKDEITDAAMKKLRSHGCTVENLLQTPSDTIRDLIYPVGFHNRKAGYILEVCKTLKEQYDSDIPRTVDELCKLKGVGPKMAHLAMNCAWGESTGIGVDVHVHRISNRLGWCTTKTPEQTRTALESWLPRDLWIPVNPLLVGFGQTICRPVAPKCDLCSLKDVCISSLVRKVRSPVKDEKEDLASVGRGRKRGREEDSSAKTEDSRIIVKREKEKESKESINNTARRSKRRIVIAEAPSTTEKYKVDLSMGNSERPKRRKASNCSSFDVS